MQKLLLFLLLFCGLQSNAQTSFYVDQNAGHDGNDGSLSAPWKTIQKACNSAIPNSIVYIKAGWYHENITVNVNGTVGNPIIFRNFFNDPVYIDGYGTTMPWLLRISNKSYLTFENLTFQNLIMSDARGVVLETPSGTSTGVTFKNLTIRNIKWTGETGQIPTSDDNALGLVVEGRAGAITNLMIDGCEIYDNVLGYSEAMILSGNVSGFTIKNCIVHDNDNIGIDLAGNYGISTNPQYDHARNGIVQRNTCYRNISPYATSAGIYVDGGQDITIEKNVCYENGIGIEVGCEEDGAAIYIMVKNNVIYNNRHAGFSVGGYDASTTGQVLACTFRNNTLLQNDSTNSGSGEISITKASNCVFEDNLFYTNFQNVFFSAGNISPQNGNLLNYNCWYTPSQSPDNVIVHWKTSTYSSFNAYKTGAEQETNSIYADPGLQNAVLDGPDINLINASDCINNGNPVLAIPAGETDINDNPRKVNGVIDIGAVEFQTSLSSNETLLSPLKSGAFPNPFVAETTVFSFTPLENGIFLLYDSQGRLVRKLENISGNQIPLSRENLQSGLYFYKIFQNNTELTSGKIIAK